MCAPHSRARRRPTVTPQTDAARARLAEVDRALCRLRDRRRDGMCDEHHHEALARIAELEGERVALAEQLADLVRRRNPRRSPEAA